MNAHFPQVGFTSLHRYSLEPKVDSIGSGTTDRTIFLWNSNSEIPGFKSESSGFGSVLTTGTVFGSLRKRIRNTEASH